MEEEEVRETNEILEEEEQRRAKITGRFLLKGVMDILADSFAGTNDDLVSRYIGVNQPY